MSTDQLSDPSSDRQLSPERFRDYLLLLAKMNMGEHLKGRLDASDIVQQTLLEACRNQQQFRGGSHAEMAAWLRRILANSLTDATRAMGRAKRDTSREQSLQAALDASSMRLEGLLAADQSTPSVKADRHEQILKLAEALTQLPDSQREALVLRHCHGWKLSDIAKKMGCGSPAVVALIQRGFKRLRTLMHDFDEPPETSSDNV